MKRTIAFLSVLGAPLALALLDTGVPSRSWWLVAAAPVGFYCIYALGISRFFPARSADSAPLRTDVMPRDSRRDPDWLLLIRGLACALVYIMHTGLAFNHDFTFGHSGWAWILESAAWLGMVMFFTLSGYLMGKGFYTGKYDLSRFGVTLFIRNRFLRIFPLMFTVGLMVVIWQSPQLLSAPQVAVRILLFEFNSLNGSDTIAAFWSLSTEWQFYLLVPSLFVMMLGATRLFSSSVGRMLLLLVMTLLVLGLGAKIRGYQFEHHGALKGWFAYLFTPLLSNIDVFLLGFLTNWWVPRLARISRLLGAIWPVLLVGIYLAYSFISYHAIYTITDEWASGVVPVGEPNRWWPAFAINLPGATALALIPVLVGCEASNRKARLRESPQHRTAFVLFWVGALTYPIYLVHSSILNSVQIGLPHESYAIRWAIATIIILVVAWVLHMTVEETVLNWRRRHIAESDTESQLPLAMKSTAANNSAHQGFYPAQLVEDVHQGQPNLVTVQPRFHGAHFLAAVDSPLDATTRRRQPRVPVTRERPSKNG